MTEERFSGLSSAFDIVSSRCLLFLCDWRYGFFWTKTHRGGSKTYRIAKYLFDRMLYGDHDGQANS